MVGPTRQSANWLLDARQEKGSKRFRRRFEVLAAAARTFNAKGFRLATLDDVARELGIRKTALYYYTRSKDELLWGCTQLAYDALDGALEGTGAGASGRDRLRHFFRFYGETVCHDFGRCLTFIHPREFTPKLRLKALARRGALDDAIRAMIVDAIEDRSLRPCDDYALVMAMFDAFDGIARWYQPKSSTSLPLIIEQYLAIFFDGV